MSHRPRTALIGSGRVARALGRGLVRAGWPVTGLAGRDPRRARAAARAVGGEVRPCADPLAAAAGARLLLLAVPAAALPGLAARLARHGGPWSGRCVLHTHGSAPGSALAALRRAGAWTGRLHPLAPFAGGRGTVDLWGTWFGLDGDPAAVLRARRLVAALGGRPLPLPPGGAPLYHLSAVLASNLLVALAAEAASLGPGYGVPRERALEALLPLMERTLDNLRRRPLARAITGPVARGETDAVAEHLRLLAERPELQAAYRALSAAALRLAREGGAPGGAAAERLDSLLAKPRRPRRRKK